MSEIKKAVLSNRIFMNFSEDLYTNCKMNLTFKIPAKIPGDPPVTISLVNIIANKFISIPIGAKHLIPEDYEIVDKRAIVPVKFPEFKFTLRESQQKIYDEVNDNCLINANTSWGKTFTCIAIATKLKQKTLVITHTVFLRDQWVKEIEKTLGIKPGIIGSGKLDYKNHNIVVCNIQTMRKHAEKLKNEFGTIILDEVHHCPASIFEGTMNIMKARYKIGASATLERKDYMHVVIPSYFSKKIYKPKEENQMTPEIYMLKTDIPFSSNNMIPWASRINQLCARKEYKELITGLAANFADAGHLTLVVSDRTKFLEDCNSIHYDRSVIVTGETKNRDELHKELENREKDILYGAISIYKEGISLNWLSCLVLATPINNNPLLRQLIGRIVRQHPNKPTPIVVDIVLKGATAKKQARVRAGHYMDRGYKIKYVELT